MLHKMTTVIPVNIHQPDQVVITKAAHILRSGGLVAFPTETVYGLGADGLNETAVLAIFAAKQRPAHDPIILHIANKRWLPRVAQHIPETAHQLMAHFWPGPLTFILPKADAVPMAVTAHGPTVAVRCPNHPLALAFIQAADTPVAAPSANLFSHTSPTTAQHVWADLNGRIDLILDGGATKIGVESTVLDLTTGVPTVRRPGGVTVEALTAVLGRGHLRIQNNIVEDNPEAPLQSPGMLARHYAPNTPLWLYSGSDENVRAAMRAAIAQQPDPALVALLISNEDYPFFADHPGPIGQVGSLENLSGVANQLFKTIRQLDRSPTLLILARNFSPNGIGRALQDRLYRAAAQRFDCT